MQEFINLPHYWSYNIYKIVCSLIYHVIHSKNILCTKHYQQHPSDYRYAGKTCKSLLEYNMHMMQLVTEQEFSEIF